MLRVARTLTSVASALASMLTAPALANGVILDIVQPSDPNEAALSWAGAQAPFIVLRSGDPSSVELLASTLGMTDGSNWTDPSSLPAPGRAFFYRVNATGPSLVSLDGRRLLLGRRLPDGSTADPAPYVMRGVVWSPAGRDTNTSPTDPNNAAVRRSEFARWAPADIPLMKAMNVNTVRMLLDPGCGLESRAVLDALYRNGIMAVITVDDAVNNLTRVQEAVACLKDHPAVLAFSLGSEFNINLYFRVASSLRDACERTETAAQLVRSLDGSHPVVASFGEINIDPNGTRDCVRTWAPSVDVWSLNVFRDRTFGTLFDEWTPMSGKPMFLGEFGTDSFYKACPVPFCSCPFAVNVDHTDEILQACWDRSLWDHLFDNLSGRDPNRVALGGAVFEWNDEWWKCQGQPPTSQQPGCGHCANPGGHPDDFANEEVFGTVDIDRRPRRVYEVLRAGFDPNYVPAPLSSFGAVSAGAAVPETAWANGFAEFQKDCRLAYFQAGGGRGAGRGFNVAVVDPNAQSVDPNGVRNFDTWGAIHNASSCAEHDALVGFLAVAPVGSLVLIAVGDEAGLNEFPNLNQGNGCVQLGNACVSDALQALRDLGSRTYLKINRLTHVVP